MSNSSHSLLGRLSTWVPVLVVYALILATVPIGRVVALMQYNMYHHFTVDEHTIFAIGILHKIEQGLLKDEVPIASATTPWTCAQIMPA